MILIIIILIFTLIFQQVQFKGFAKKYVPLDSLELEVQKKQKILCELNDNYQKREDELKKTYETLENDKQSKYSLLAKNIDSQMTELNSELKILTNEVLNRRYTFSDYDGLSSEECKNKLSILKLKEQDLIKNDKAVEIHWLELNKMTNMTLDNRLKKSLEKITKNNIKLTIRCFNAECDNIILGISIKNIDSMRSKMQRSYDSINKIISINSISIAEAFLELKLEQLNLVYTYELKKEQEKEIQKAIKEQMLEEEKVRREIEKEKAKIQKDQDQCSSEINKLMKYLQKTDNDVEKQLYLDKIKELENKLRELESNKKTVLEREANAKAGYVYIISNIGSFGEDVYKIGMTRRLEPMDRIKELSSASVPFEFDVHAMIFSVDAPSLETTLHQYFNKQSINRINPRKEFFKVSIDEIEEIVKEKYNNTVEFTKIPIAREYRQSIALLGQTA